MAWNNGWDAIFSEREWGKYPPEQLIRFIARTYYSAPQRKVIKILEVGCGPGANIWYLSREGFSAFGIDGSHIAIEQAKNRLEAEKLSADLRVGDILKLPYEDSFFDCVIDIECIYANSFSDSKIIIEEIYRVLKPGGKFFSKTFMVGTHGDGNGPRVEGESNTYQYLMKGVLKQGYGIIRFTAEEEIGDLYSRFSIISIDQLIQSENNRSYEIREWLILCAK